MQLAHDHYSDVSASMFTVYLRDGDAGQAQITINQVPEPSTYALMIVGMFALEAARRLRRSRGKGSLATRAA